MDEKIYWLNKDSKTFLKRGYLLEGETPESRMRDIADGAEQLLGLTGFGDKFERYLHAGYYSLSSPIWSNFARERGLPISCFGSFIPDTMSGIFGKLSEVAMMTKGGGGTSGYFGDIRPRGSVISSGGTSTGAVHFMELYDKTMNVVSQGNVRRGSFAAYLPIDHGDIEEFLQIKGDGHSIQDMSIGVCVSDEWMRSMIDGDKHKRKIWGLVIKKRFESGYPYLMFSDNANNAAPQVYKDKGLRINNSNLCLVGDTKIEVSTHSDGTDPVVLNIDEFCSMFKLGIWPDIFVKSYDGTKPVWSKVTCADQTGSVTELIEIESETGNIIRCTPEHKILTQNRGWVCAKDLDENDTLIND
jgi:ribonucleoside-diphosphate reductase alpha chain